MSLETTTKIVNSIARALSHEKVTGYLFGDLLKYRLTNQSQHLRNNVIDIAVSFSDDFNVDDFYSFLLNEITINSEIKHSETQYHVLSDGYILRFELIKDFSPQSLESVKRLGRFTIDTLFQNIHTKEIIDYSGQGAGHLNSESVIIKSIIPPSEWGIDDCLEFAVKVSQFEESTIPDEQLQELKTKNLMDLPGSVDFESKELLLDLLLSYEPGKAFQFLIETYSDGLGWSFIELVNFMSSIDVPMKEGITSTEVFTDKKLQLLDVYSQFYLFDKHTAETPKERTERLHTSLRLLFDTPALNIEIPYIDSVSVITASAMPQDQTTFRAMQLDPFCPYGICPPCVPEECDPQCCCCSATDMIRDARTRCHKQITLSCAVDSSGDVIGFDIPPYDPEDPYQGEFPPGSRGAEACETVLAIRDDDPRTNPSYCENWEGVGATELWWTVPSGNWPCTCHCASDLVGAPGDCELTCVTCFDFYCGSDVNISGHDCFYNLELTPADGCCGSPAVVDFMFVIDFSGSMTDEIGEVRNQVNLLADKLADTGIGIRVGLVVFGQSEPEPYVAIPLTEDIAFFKSELGAVPIGGGTEWDIEATFHAAITAQWRGHANFIVLIGDEGTQYRPGGSCGEPGADCLNATKTVLDWFNITVYVADAVSASRQELADHTNGKRYDILDPFSDLVDDLNIAVYPTSCKCINEAPVPIVRDLAECRCSDPWDYDCLNSLPSHCYDIPINICYPNEPCDCTLPINLFACGNSIVVNPGATGEDNLVCCSELNSVYGIGCDCRQCEDEIECCGPDCFNLCEEFPNDQFPWGSEEGRRAIVDSIWLDCWDKKAAVDTALFPNCTQPCCPDGADLGDRNFPCSRLRDPSDPACQSNPQQCQDLLDQGLCCDCPDFDDCCNCCLLFQDENCELSTRYCFNDIRNQTVDYIINVCLSDGETQPPPDWEPPSLKCLKDRCIVGEPQISPSDRDSIDDQCANIYKGETTVRHPSVVVLNNGIGLVAYERTRADQPSEIRIQQFKTTVQEKVMPNREFNFGRLQNPIRWETQSGELYRSAKLYYYEEIPQHLISTSDNPDPSDPDSWGDVLVFRNGPLEKQFFALAPTPLGSDDVGDYIRFFLPSDVDFTTPFPSSDDIYNIKFFILDSEDAPDNNKGFIGDSDDSTTDGASYIFSDRRQVDSELLQLSHIYKGENAPVAYPSLATAYNYSDGLENAHWVYLAYQAFEDDKWNVYLRQIRLSEYSRKQQIDSAVGTSNLITLEDLGIEDVVLRVFCTSDECRPIGDTQYLLIRTVVLEMLIADGREVLNNPDLSGSWPSLCPGYSSGEFDKSKVFVQLIHSVVADRCPDQFGFNEIFYNWKAGQEFTAPAASVSGTSLFSLLAIQNDTSVEVGTFDPPVTAGGAAISSSSVASVYYQNSSDTLWSVISNPAFDVLSRFKGMDIGAPIPLTSEEEGHGTRPVVKVNYNNDVFVAYESTETGIPQIKLKGTSTPSSTLPVGTFNARSLDATVSSFYSPIDFVYTMLVTGDGINQQPDMYIDLNDVLHLTWQSNRDGRWEIYYTSSDTNFIDKRITNHIGKSLNPAIDGDDKGRLYITWHDDRYGDYEIMLAYYLGSRVLPLAQQDPYLAGMRNDGYIHYANEVTVVLTNESNFPICFNDIIVDFYAERTLENLEFSVALSDYSFAFDVPDAQNDTTTQTFTAFGDWSSTAVSGGDIYESPEYDSSLSSSAIASIYVDYDTFNMGDSVEISFKASDTPNDSIADWTDFAPITDSLTTLYSSLGLPEITGRYKSVRLKRTYSVTPATINTVTIISESRHRLCLGPNASTTATLDLTPEIRIDATGTREAEFPIPIGFARNNTYFVGARTIDDDGNEIQMPDQYASVSCESCSSEASAWNLSSCSVKLPIESSSDEQELHNFKITIYHDESYTYKIGEFSASYGSSDLEYFTVDGVPAQSVWLEHGMPVDANIPRELIFWPSLSPTIGLICGVKYFFKIESCYSLVSSESECQNLTTLTNVEWICNCQSLRWDARFEDSPVNLRDVVRWNSSGDGSSDTRITETIGANNINPRIRMRSNLNGLILYESNRQELSEVNYDPSTYRIYASVFSIVPKAGMYSTSSQTINTGFESIVFRSDIPICPVAEDFFCNDDNLPCDSCYENDTRKPAEEFLRGHNIALDLDQFDSIFMALEVPYKNSSDPIECNQFVEDRQQYIAVHSCGADALDLFRVVDEETGVTQGCNPSEIVGKTYSGQLDPTFRKIVIEIRVRNNHVKYHITRNNQPLAVVDSCLVDLEIIAIPETITIRLRNAGTNWGDWIQFHPDIGDNTMRVSDWRLSSGSGIKLVQFEAATQSGLSQTGTLSLVADYARVDHEVRFFKPLATSPTPEENEDLATLVGDAGIWVEDNMLNTLDGVPVAAMRPPTTDSESNIITPDSDYIFVEIEPGRGYVDSVTDLPANEKLATFDFIHQGGDDQFNLPTVLVEQAGRLVFRGVILISRDNQATSRDGLAYIIPHFSNDCSDAVSPNVTESSAFEKDSLNQIVSGVPETIQDQGDIFDRDSLGKVKHAITIRPNEDPYFVFGDPNYRLETNE